MEATGAVRLQSYCTLKHTRTQINEITHLSHLTKRFKLTAAFGSGKKTGKQNSQLEGGRKNELTEFHIGSAVQSFIKLACSLLGAF